MNSEKRHVGFDLLKIVSMIMIITLHVIGISGILNETKDSLNVFLGYTLESICLCSVNCYVLISGFFLVESNTIKKSTIIKVYGIFLFYQICVSLILVVLGCHFSLKDIIFTLFPFITHRNWFVNNYLLLYLLHPFINVMLKELNEMQLKKLVILLLMFFCIPQTFLPKLNWTIDETKGYGITWFITLYIISVFYKRYMREKLKKKRKIIVVLIFLLSAVMPVLFKYVSSLIINDNEFNNKIYYYNTLPVLVASMSLLILFDGVVITNKNIQKLIYTVSVATYGIFLIHTQFKLVDLIIEYRFLKELVCQYGIITANLVVCPAVFLVCLLIEILRGRIVCLIKNVLDKMEDK